MVQADKKAEELKKQRSMEEFDAFMAKCNEIEDTEGKAARDAYEKQYQIDKDAAEAQKKVDVEKLKRKLLDAGQDPYSETDAERQVFLLEHDVDLELIAGTPQNELRNKNFLQSRGKKKGSADEYQKNQRYIVACQVSDLKARGIDPLEHFSDPDVIDKTRAIYKMDDRVAAKVAGQYKSLMEEHGGRLTPAKEGEVPFVYSEEAATAAATSGAVAGGGATSKEEKAAARAAAKAKRVAEKEAAKKERAEARAQKKAEKQAAKERRLAEKSAAATAALAAKEAEEIASESSIVPLMDGDVSATGNDEFFQPEPDIESSTAVVSTQEGGGKSTEIINTIKTYATPKNVATVVIGGAAVKFGMNYYAENNAAAQSEREQQLKLILGADDDEDEDEDDEFDDDEEDG